MNRGQTSLLDEIIVDNFAGGGGASTGIELATGRVVDIAINHDPDAILMHRTNHPYTEHYQASVWDIDPKEVCRGRPVGLAWFSPDCKHFSKAKGAALVDRKIRGLAWIVLRWAALVRPRVIILENVEEFKTWGPVRRGKPVKSKAGQTFDKWYRQLRELGYEIEYRELVAADYGAPTSRKRFVLVARCDGKPIRWPERTHASRDSEEVRAGKCKPWRSAAQIIDWSIPCPSVFASKAEIKAQYGLKAVRPLAANTLRRVIRGVDKFTIRSGEPFIVECNHSGDGHLQSKNYPVNTITGKCSCGLAKPVISPFTFSNTGGSVGAPLHQPIGVVRTAGGLVYASAQMIQYHTEQSENVRANSVAEPIQTLDTSNRYGLTMAHLTEYYGNGQPIDIREPMHTVTSHDREAVTAVHLVKYFTGITGESVAQPLPTITTVDHNAVCSAHIAEFKGQDLGQDARKPLRTITASAGEFAAVHTKIVRYVPGAELGYWPEIRDLLNQHCGYQMQEDEILLLNVLGAWFFICDIGLRMLKPRELYSAMGFPRDYIIDRDYMGNDYGKTKQVERCGNAVCPPMAEAVVRANLPEWCGNKIETMAAFTNAVAV